MNMTTIERADLADKEALMDLMQKQFSAHEIEYSTDTLLTAIEEMLLNESLGLFIVAREKDLVIGLAAISFAWTLEHGGKSAWLDELYVLPEWRDQGVGSLLIEAVSGEVKKEGCLAIDLEVEEAHRRVEHLYKRKGFEKLERSRWAKYL